LTDSGTFPVWLKDNRRLLIVSKDGSKISMLDRETRQVTDVLDVKPNTVESLSQLSTDNKTIVFGLEQREADIWLLSRDTPK
jgi:hypothetical protein